MASHFYGEGVQRVSLSPSDSGHDPGDMEPCAEPLPMEIDEMSPGNGPCGGRFPADTPITPPAIGLTHTQFCDKIKDKPLPGDGSGRECFDTFPTFVVGDQVIWKDIFRHILKECSYLTAFNTVYVMVDTRNLMAHGTAQDGLPHWPAAVAWWRSRVQLIGPHQEKTELLFFPAAEETGLHRVHPTWAGTFVLAALVSIFPGINFILLDSDCLPVTLFEAAHLWKEAYLTRFPSGTGKGLPQRLPLHRKREFANRSIHSIGSMPTGRDKVSFLSLSHTLNSTLAWLWFLAPHTHHCSIGLTGHVAVDVCQTHSLIHCLPLLRRKLSNLFWHY